MSRNLLFISGPSGVGKTEVGSWIAQKICVPFYDLDEELERTVKLNISDLVVRDGWPEMRRLEKETLLKLVQPLARMSREETRDHDLNQELKYPFAIISLGGGSAIDEESRQLMTSEGALITLWATPNLIEERRIHRANRDPDRVRPIPQSDVKTLILDRLSVYLKCDAWIETLLGESKSQLGDRVIRAFSIWHQCQRQGQPTPKWLQPPLHLIKQSQELEQLHESETTGRLENSSHEENGHDFESEEFAPKDDPELQEGLELDDGEKPKVTSDKVPLLPDLDLLEDPDDFYEEIDDPQVSELLKDLKPSQAQDLLDIIDQYAEELVMTESRDELDSPVPVIASDHEDVQILQVNGYQVHFRRDDHLSLIDFIIHTTQSETSRSHPKVVVMSDETVARLYSDKLVATLRQRGLQAHLVTFPVGERSKSLRVLEALVTRLLKIGVHRKDWLIAFGGGVTGDLCGLLAALYMRGLKWAQIPTSLLAQVDSSVGAKTAVNHPLGKNLIGAFYRPEWVWIDQAYLRTLPPRHIRTGWVEALKHGLIADQDLFELLSQLGGRFTDDENEHQWGTLLRRSVCIKAQIVEGDEHEQDQRMLLNLGHTLGHAFEACHHDLLHGEAVALGICATLDYASHYGNLSRQDASRVKEVFRSAGLSVDWRALITDQVWKRVAFDKKRSSHQIQFVTLNTIGSAQCEMLSFQEFEERVNKLL